MRSDSNVFQPAIENRVKFTGLRRAVVAVIGFTVLLIGFAMVVLPGPAIVVIPFGLAILATEFVWARRLLEKARATVSRKERKPKPLPAEIKSREASVRHIDELKVH